MNNWNRQEIKGKLRHDIERSLQVTLNNFPLSDDTKKSLTLSILSTINLILDSELK